MELWSRADELMMMVMVTGEDVEEEEEVVDEWGGIQIGDHVCVFLS